MRCFTPELARGYLLQTTGMIPITKSYITSLYILPCFEFVGDMCLYWL